MPNVACGNSYSEGNQYTVANSNMKYQMNANNFPNKSTVINYDASKASRLKRNIKFKTMRPSENI